jgi:hypothetical protein
MKRLVCIVLTNVILYQNDELTKKEKKQQAKDEPDNDKSSKKVKKEKDAVRTSIL